MEAEEILKELGIEQDIIAIYPYGSQVYGNATKYSDNDYIIVAKSTLPSGAFKDNAISNENRTIQGTLYSRAGFIDAINNYEMPAMEAISLDPDDIVLKKWPFKISKWYEKDLIKNIIKNASSSRYTASKNVEYDHIERAKKGMFHALRILHFGLQLKEHKKIINFSECNDLHKKMMAIDDDDFKIKSYYSLFDKLASKMKK